MRLKNFGPLPSMRNPPTRRVVRRAWTVGRLTGSLPFPRSCKLIQTPGFSKRHSHDAQFALPQTAGNQTLYGSNTTLVGVITGTAVNPRLIQFGLRYSF